MKVNIEKSSGFCFGVKNAVDRAGEILQDKGKLYCLGDIVHNGMEIERLKSHGLRTINYEQFETLRNSSVLLRAHGEPPSTYATARANNIELIDASCPVVLQLQKKIKREFARFGKQHQVVIFGKATHPEVISLVGQTNGEAIVVSGTDDLKMIDFAKPVSLFAQTTMETNKYLHLANEIRTRMHRGIYFKLFNSFCGAVSGREQKLIAFSKQNDTIIFVGGKKSSNGIMLFSICKKVNPDSHYISNIDELNPVWFDNMNSVGICGATSTPVWQLEQIADTITNFC